MGRDNGCCMTFVTSYSLCRSWSPLSLLDGSGWDDLQGCLQLQPCKTSDFLDLSASTTGYYPSGKVPTAPGYWEPDSLRKPGSLVYSLFSTRTHCLMSTKGPTQVTWLLLQSLAISNKQFIPPPPTSVPITYPDWSSSTFQGSHLDHCSLSLPPMGSHYLPKPHRINANLKPRLSDSDRIWLAIPVLLHPRQVILDKLFTLLEPQSTNLWTEQWGLEWGGASSCKVLT